MTTFHFHLRSGDQLTLDEEGEDFADYASALSEVNLAARDLVVQAIRSGKHRVPDAFVIADGSGKELGTLSFETICQCHFRVSLCKNNQRSQLEEGSRFEVDPSDPDDAIL